MIISLFQTKPSNLAFNYGKMKLPEPPSLNTRAEIYKGDCHIWKKGNINFYEAHVLIETKAEKHITFQIKANGKMLFSHVFEASLSEMVTINDACELISIYQLYHQSLWFGSIRAAKLNLSFSWEGSEIYFYGEK